MAAGWCLCTQPNLSSAGALCSSLVPGGIWHRPGGQPLHTRHTHSLLPALLQWPQQLHCHHHPYHYNHQRIYLLKGVSTNYVRWLTFLSGEDKLQNFHVSAALVSCPTRSLFHHPDNRNIAQQCASIEKGTSCRDLPLKDRFRRQTVSWNLVSCSTK